MKQAKAAIAKGALFFFGDEKRQRITIPIFAILFSLVLGSIIILFIGHNPIQAYTSLLQGSGLLQKANYAGGKSMLTDFTSFINALTPTLFATLSICVGLRAGLFNIGVSGQMLFAGYMSTILVGYSDLPALVAKPLVIVVAALFGALLAGLIGYLKYRFNINEVVSSIMFNYIVQYITGFFINTKYIDVISRQSRVVSSQSQLTLTSYPVGDLKMDIPLGIVLALICVALLHIYIERTTYGYELKTVGSNPESARYSGISVGRTLVVSMMISGALAGLAGATYYLGYFSTIPPGVLPSIGFDAIAVALLANANPIGAIFTSFVITIFSKGSIFMSSSTGMVSEIASVITAVVLLCSACSGYVSYKIKQAKDVVGGALDD
ncbi:MAG: ABC transporter permease [Eubacteriales bacterium]